MVVVPVPGVPAVGRRCRHRRHTAAVDHRLALCAFDEVAVVSAFYVNK